MPLASLILLVAPPPSCAQDTAQTLAIYSDGVEVPFQMRPWGMKWEERDGGAAPGAKHIWFNADWKAHPWAGVTFVADEAAGITLTQDWLGNGFIRFQINGGLDQYAIAGSADSFQVKLEVAGGRYQRISARFIDRGRGIDEDPATWQEVLIPLSYWTELQAGQVVRGLSIQCVLQPRRSFGFDEISLVRFDRQPAWLAAELTEDVAQPRVEWPEYQELPEILKADRHPPRVRDGKFVWPDGKRVFLLNPYCREDPRLDVRGRLSDEPGGPPNHALYDPGKHGWIYDEILSAESLCRLGYNSYSASMPAEPWWRAVGLDRRDSGMSAEPLPRFAGRIGMPFFVDMVCWPWTLGAPAGSPDDSDLPPETFTVGHHHWTPYRIIGAGREAWLKLWRLYAQRYRDAGATALVFELMNEPAYVGLSDDHRAEFTEWLTARYETIAELNRVWGTDLASWADAASFADRRELESITGRALDYDEYLAGRFTELIADGVGAVNEIQSETLVGLQTMGGYALQPREAVWKHRIAPLESIVLAPTGGGRWTNGHRAQRSSASVLQHPIAPAPIENDLLLALAGDKMTYDNETYLRGQTAVEVRNRLWEQVLAGLDGLTVFSWSKRGWAWWKTRAEVQTEADKYPYSLLNPIARRTDALRGIHDFAAEVQPLADLILPKPWGPQPKIGVLYNWANIRRITLQPDLPNKTGAYYAALKFTHWNAAIVPSHQAADGALDGLDVLVLGGIIHIERELLPVLQAFVERGGVLIVGEEPFASDLYGHPVDSNELTGVHVGDTVRAENAVLALPGEQAVALRAGFRALQLADGTEVVAAASTGQPIITRRALGPGRVYYQGADLIGYGLAELLGTILRDASSPGALPDGWRLADIAGDTGTLAPNILLSRRSYESHHALLLMNMDAYPKDIRVRVSLGNGRWTVTEGVTQQPIPAAEGQGTWPSAALRGSGIPVHLEGGHPAVLLIRASGS